MHRDLVERAMAGDHEAFSELARIAIGRLYVAARLILRDEGRAEDATQEAP
jgi:DNA-directed RNA polymerase specialized sigma24 family protein